MMIYHTKANRIRDAPNSARMDKIKEVSVFKTLVTTFTEGY